MDDVHRLPTVKKIEQEASEWVARLNADDVTAEDRARFDAWRSADPLNSQAFEDFLRTWQRFLNAAPLMQARVGIDSERSRGGLPRQRRILAVAAAAAVATLVIGIYNPWSAKIAHFTTAIGQQLTVPLADGSFMELNSDSAARVDYSARRRTIHLERGEAFFRVAHDVNRPFWVTAGHGWVRAVGTEFNVYLRSTSLQVTVREGTVRAGESPELLPTDAQPDERKLPVWVTLTGGQQADLERTSAHKRALTARELANAMAWRGGAVYFENRPLSEVAAELNRYSTEPLILEDDALRALPVGGAFQAGPQGAAALVRMLEQNFGVTVRRDGTGIHLYTTPIPGG